MNDFLEKNMNSIVFGDSYELIKEIPGYMVNIFELKLSIEKRQSNE